MSLPGPATVRRALAAYRATGADLPFGDPLRAHDVAMEGYFWRFTDPATGRVPIALSGINRGPDGSHWATLGSATHRTGFLRTTVHGGIDRARAEVTRRGGGPDAVDARPSRTTA